MALHLLLVDGLAEASAPPQTWPDAYFQGHPWPSDYFRRFPPIYAVEIHGRGLDRYIWSEGYIIRGSGAGFLVRASIPYLPGHAKASAMRVYSGPYPPLVPASLPSEADSSP